jgi:hypothetical protein
MDTDTTLDLFQPSGATTTQPALQSLWTRTRDGKTVRVVGIDGAGRITYWTLGPIIDAAYAREIKGEGTCRDTACWHELFTPNERAEMFELASMAHAAFSYLAITSAECDHAQFKQRAERAWGAMCHARQHLPG